MCTRFFGGGFVISPFAARLLHDGSFLVPKSAVEEQRNELFIKINKGETEMIELGLAGKDKITGFTGIITGMCKHLTGCNQYCLVPKSKDGNELKGGEWFDEGRIVVIGPGILQEDVQGEINGGPQRDLPNIR